MNGRLSAGGPERRLLDGLVESVEGGGTAVLVVGEAGIGKTALLTQVAEMVSHRPGMRVLRARGVESEAVLAFAAIADLLCPLHERFVELPHGERQYSAEDLAGHHWTFTQAIADLTPEDWGGTTARPRLASSQDCSRPVAVVTVVCHEACRLPPPGPGPPARRAQHAQARAGLVHSPTAGTLRRRLPGAGIRAGVASPGAPAIPLSPEGGNQRSREAAGTPIRPRAQPPICTARARAVREVVRRRTGCSARFRHAGRGKPRHAVAVILRHA